MLQKSDIEFYIDKSRIEGISDMNNDVFPNHFLALICGKPGSGKTSLLKFMLREPRLLFKKFDYVFIISPSYREYADLYLPNSNLTNALNYTWVMNKVALVKKLEQNSKYVNVLFILDDVISDLHATSKYKPQVDLIFNRRHLIPNGMISIIMTTQKYKMVPSTIRSNLNILVTFKLHNTDLKQIKEELIYSDVDFDKICRIAFAEPDSFLVYRTDNNSFFKNFDKIII